MSGGVAKAVRWGLALALVVALVFLRGPAAEGVAWLGDRLVGLGAWGPVAFVAAAALAIPLCLPAAPFFLAAGILFGPVEGILYGAAGNLAGGSLSFWLGRRLLRAPLERRLASEAGFAAMARALRQEGLRVIALVRLSPMLPTWMINYALGVCRVGWRAYLLSSVTVLPMVGLYTFAGAGLGDLAALGRGAAPPRGVGYYALLGGGLAATLAASILLGRRARRILSEEER